MHNPLVRSGQLQGKEMTQRAAKVSILWISTYKLVFLAEFDLLMPKRSVNACAVM